MAIRKQAEPAVAREPVREEARTPGIGHNRPPAGRAVAVGRDGQPIWRHGAANVGFDKFAIPQEMVPPGWVYQWKTHTVLGKEDSQYMGQLRTHGWTPVMAEAHPGMFMPLDCKGPIIVDGLMLMETPESLYLEAVHEDKRKAADQVNRRTQAHGMTAATPTVSTDSLGDRRNTFVRKAVDAGADIPRPKYDRQPID